ncbi:calmodulin-like [Acanthaster planci]|uniref:Calmodulin-like n=1 Tax=Acanthaster planci TaxID=133434 RepID=A0A8B8A370_ACAPL|nr:calmodulin-like [Acanthaster planci]
MEEERTSQDKLAKATHYNLPDATEVYIMSAQRSSGLRLPALMLALLSVFAAIPSHHARPRPAMQKRKSPTRLGAPSHTELFKMYDVDSNSFLEPIEVMLLLQRPDQVNAVDEFVLKLKTVFNKAETNGDGKLDIEEFDRAVSAEPRAPTQVEASGTFELFDENGDQVLNYNEVANAIQRMTENIPSSDFIEQMFARTDTNGDGAIDQNEFTRAMQVQDQSEIPI